jgi:hypothetical protein
MKAWILKLVRSSVKLVVEEALVSARDELLKELETSTMFKAEERAQVTNITEMLVTKVISELNKKI